MSSDAVPFFSRIRHNWFMFILSVATLVLLACLAVAVIGNGPDHDRNFPVPGGVGNVSSTDTWLAGAEGWPVAIEEYYQETGAVREQLTPDDVLARARESGGFTYNPLYGATPQQGYAVSLNGHGEVLDDTATADDLLEYLQENLDQVKDPGRYVGGWIDDGRLCLDVSIVLQDGKEARSTGRINDQTGIFDLEAGVTVYLKGPDGQWLVDGEGNWLSMCGPGTAAASAA